MDIGYQIKLAKLVGIKDWTELGTPMVPSYDGCEWEHYRQWNPKKSADDDYAVLEWLIHTAMGTVNEPQELQLPKHQYQIGDYARSALKVID